jgi:hypothetical protein
MLGPICKIWCEAGSSARNKNDLSRFLREAESEESVITRNDKPAGVLIGFESGSPSKG